MLQALSNITNNYTCLQAHVTTRLHGKAAGWLTWQISCLITNNARKIAKAICLRL